MNEVKNMLMSAMKLWVGLACWTEMEGSSNAYDEPEHYEPLLVQEECESLNSGHVHRLGHERHVVDFTCCVDDSEGDNDPAKPAMQHVVIVERDVGQLDQRAVAAGHEYQGKHVRHRHAAYPVP